MKTSLQDRVAREEQAHECDNVLEESYKLKNRFRHIWSYPSRKRLEKRRNDLLQNLNGKDVLDYGCGWGENGLIYYKSGANITGIDISEKFIKSANFNFQSKGCDNDRYSFIKMDAHDLKFNDDTFDFVVGDGILHHLDAEIALSEIYRVLKPGGRVLLFEPLADNPLLKLFRLLTPKARTIDEAPITGKNLRRYSCRHSWESDHLFCGVLEAPMAILTSIILPNRPENILLKATEPLERWMITNNVLLSWNQYVLLNFKK